MYLALGVTAATYILISLGVFGTLTVDEVVAYGEEPRSPRRLALPSVTRGSR